MIVKGSNKLLVILLLAIIIIPISYAGLQFYSLKSAKKSIINPRINLGITDLLDIQSTITNILLRGLEGEFDLQFEGHGVISTNVKSIQAKVFLEEVYVGSFVSNEFFTIPASGIETAHMEFKIDLKKISLSDVEQVFSSILDYNGELKVSIEALMEPIIIVFPITMPVTETKYVLTYSDAPQVVSLNWNSPTCEVGDDITFSCDVKNVFRDSQISGTLDVLVREDVSLGLDSTADIFSYPIQLDPGESTSLSDDFTPYKKGSTQGFFLRAQWGGSIIKEQTSQYPPRLQVIEGTLVVEDVYWTVDGVRASACEVDDLVEAHIRFGAVNAALDDDVVARIRKDLVLLPDANFVSESYHIVLSKNQDREIVVSFRPTEATGSLLRGYFVEIEGDVQWTMPDEYPPRLTVNSYKLPQGSLSVTNVWWSSDGITVTSGEVGENFEGKIKIKAVNGAVSGEITTIIKRDLAFSADTSYATKSFTFSLNDGEERTFTVPFIASEASSSSFRGYFIEVQGNLLWTMSNSYPPRLTINEPASIPEPTGYPVVQNAWWTSNGVTITQASQGQSVSAVTRIIVSRKII